MSGKGDVRRPEAHSAPPHHRVFCRQCEQVHEKGAPCPGTPKRKDRRAHDRMTFGGPLT